MPIFAILSQRLSKRIPVAFVVALGNLLFAIGTVLVITSAATHVQYATQVLPGWMLSGIGIGIGIGIGLAVPRMIASDALDLAPDQSATGSAVVNTARQLGYVLGVAILIAILGSLNVASDQILTSFQHGWWFIAIAPASAVTAFGITSRVRAVQPRLHSNVGAFVVLCRPRWTTLPPVRRFLSE
ncbi:hypothetical protein ACIA8C_18360 [Nocardia sp. NPDC051321]|uniref:hypothetical protein n=1 Tax=Nocardia sp. NPDC051321 TaxID=3364323 RepID=UPI0037B62C69